MKDVVALMVLVLGVLLAAYLGIYVMFIGGIVQVINAIKATPVEAMGVALGAARVLFAGLVGWGTFAVTFILAKVISE